MIYWYILEGHQHQGIFGPGRPHCTVDSTELPPDVAKGAWRAPVAPVSVAAGLSINRILGPSPRPLRQRA